MTDTSMIIGRPQPTGAIVISGVGGRELLAIHRDGTVTGSVEDASEAGARFVAYLRGHLAPLPSGATDSITDLIAEAREQVPDRWRTHELGTRDRIIRGLADALEAEHKRAVSAEDLLVRVAGVAASSIPDLSLRDKPMAAVVDLSVTLSAAEAERDRYRAEAESARKTGERILTDALRYRAALEDALGHAHECYRSDLTCVDVRILARVLNEGATDV